MNFKKLSEIADIQSGLVLRRKEAKFDSENVFKYMQLNLRSVNEDGSVSVDALTEYCSYEKLNEQFITRENEIIMRLFAPICPVVVTEDISGLVVPSQFSIIRVKSHEILPSYLCCYLSQGSVLNEMALMGSGQAFRGIKISTLSDIQIPLVSLAKQKAISSLAEKHRERKKLYLELIHQYDVQADAAIKGAIGGETYEYN